MIILGINAFHADASACLLVDGHVVAAVAEERLGRRLKHASGFPSNAIRCVLAIGGVDISGVDAVAIGYDQSANRFAKLSHIVRSPADGWRRIRGYLKKAKHGSSMREMIADAVGAPVEKCRFAIHSVEHHLAHMASSFFSSSFEESAGFTYDGSGDFVSAIYAHCRGNQIIPLQRIYLPHSLGIFYTSVCQFIGFDGFGEEYKVMGLAAYGKPDFMPVMQRALSYVGSGKYKMGAGMYAKTRAQDMFVYDEATGKITIPMMYSDAWSAELGAPRNRNAPLTDRDRGLAASCQEHFERVVLECVRWLHSRVPSNNLVTAGGCALNGVCNARILREGPFKSSYIQCAAADDGTAIGAAQYVYHHVLGSPRVNRNDNPYLGPAHSQDAMDAALAENKLSFQRLSDAELIQRCAALLAEGKVIAWYQGGAEWGPRALGNRSILANPGWPGMKDLINNKIKRRESFRPFAPSILADRVKDIFEQDVESPFMMHVVKIRPEWRDRLSAVSHEDHTGRLQTVTRAMNQRYYDLISAFAEKTGIPVLLNTSFNENEPIVDTPEQAVACHMRNDLDVLVLGNSLSVKC